MSAETMAAATGNHLAVHWGCTRVDSKAAHWADLSECRLAEWRVDTMVGCSAEQLVVLTAANSVARTAFQKVDLKESHWADLTAY